MRLILRVIAMDSLSDLNKAQSVEIKPISKTVLSSSGENTLKLNAYTPLKKVKDSTQRISM